MELEDQPQYFTDRKTDLIVFDRISTRLANLNDYMTMEETQVNEVYKIQNVNSPFPRTQWGVVRTKENWMTHAPCTGAADSQF